MSKVKHYNTTSKTRPKISPKTQDATQKIISVSTYMYD